MFDFAFWYTLILLILMIVVLVKEIFDPDIVIFSVLLLLIVGRVIDSKEAFAGFSNSGMLTIGFLFIVARALQETGVLNRLGDILLGSKVKSIRGHVRTTIQLRSISSPFPMQLS